MVRDPVLLHHIYDPDDWEYTYRWSDRYDLVEKSDLSPGETRKFATLIDGPSVWAGLVVLSRDEDGNPDKTKVEFFFSEEEARKGAHDESGS